MLVPVLQHEGKRSVGCVVWWEGLVQLAQPCGELAGARASALVFFLGMQLHHSKAEKSDGQIMSCDLGFQKYRLLGNANCP